ncbi:MAG: hypothetical protein QN178_06255 [Armatimonadota bacterium]|nr:hypothetical protein [Armatimonadota bacterium]
MRRLAQTVARRVLGSRTRWLDGADGPAEIEITPLVCPLRYDVLTRKQFIEFIDGHREMYARDRQAFLARARRQPYAVWLDGIVIPRHLPRLVNDPEGRARWLDERMLRFVALYDAMAARGFDREHPVEIRITNRLEPTVTGKTVQARFILGDGSHRLAFLMTRGYTALPRHLVRIRWFERLVPFDSTATLARLIPLDEPSYAAYLSSLYSAPVIHVRVADLVADVADRRPDRADEVRQVIAADGFADVTGAAGAGGRPA